MQVHPGSNQRWVYRHGAPATPDRSCGRRVIRAGAGEHGAADAWHVRWGLPVVAAIPAGPRAVRIVGPTSTLPVPRLQSSAGEYSLVLAGLTRDLQTGTCIELTMNFERNGSKTMLVPVQTSPGGAPRPTGEYEVPDTDSAGSPLGNNEAAPE